MSAPAPKLKVTAPDPHSMAPAPVLRSVPTPLKVVVPETRLLAVFSSNTAPLAMVWAEAAKALA